MISNEAHSYVEGYKQCLTNLENHINESIVEHKGATTAIDVLNVFNSIIEYISREKLHLRQEPQRSDRTLYIIVDNEIKH